MLALPESPGYERANGVDIVGRRPIESDRRYFKDGELEALVYLVASVKPSRVLEIGINAGRAARAILRHVRGIELYEGVEVLPGYVPAKEVQRHEPLPVDEIGRFVRHDPRFRLILRKRGSLDLTAADLAPTDAVFIDGDHGREAVEHDSSLAFALVRAGGIVIWHDYHDLGTVDVRDVLHEIAARGVPILHVAGTWLAFARRGSHVLG